MVEMFKRYLLASVVLFLVTIPCLSQSVTATLRGTVHDPAGAVIPAATVTATNTEKGINRTVTTNERGDYVITQLPAQSYSISVSAPGFQTQTHEKFVLQNYVRKPFLLGQML